MLIFSESIEMTLAMPQQAFLINGMNYILIGIKVIELVLGYVFIVGSYLIDGSWGVDFFFV
jgi:hypothetical protein